MAGPTYLGFIPIDRMDPERVRDLYNRGKIDLTPEQFELYTRDKIAPRPAAPAMMGARIPTQEKRGASDLRSAMPQVESMPSTPIYNKDRGF